MLASINLDIQANNLEDFEYFKVLFLRNVGIDQMMYNFYLGDVMIRLQITGSSGAQLIGIGFFHYSKVGKSVSLEQFNPLNDIRFQNFAPIISLWSKEPRQAWAYLHHFQDDAEDVLEKIRELLNIINRINNLKAFL